MKSKDLIAKIQELDPTGEVHCCIHNADLWEPTLEPAYYDGRLQVIDRDANGKPLRGTRISEGDKINLAPLYISDALERAEFKVEYMTEEDRAYWEKSDLSERAYHREIEFAVEMGMFTDWVFVRIQSIRAVHIPNVPKIKAAAEAFYKEHRGPDKDGKAVQERKWGWEKGSWLDRLHELWDEIIFVDWDNYGRVIIKFKDAT